LVEDASVALHIARNTPLLFQTKTPCERLGPFQLMLKAKRSRKITVAALRRAI